jgi:AmmeMemoRadiSam system protein A
VEDNLVDPLTKDQEGYLLGIARRAIENLFEARDEPPKPPEDSDLARNQGAFVTLKVEGELRGCVGYPLPVKPLFETVAETAVAAASQDFRFDPLSQKELDRVTIEISVLSPPQPVDDPDEVKIGLHGIIVSKGIHKGLLLPQVPVEHSWDRETYLRHGCLKAGLDPEEWKKGVKIEVFTARVFSE